MALKKVWRRLLRRYSGYAIGAIALIWVFHDVDIGRLAARMLWLEWSWVGLALCIDLLSYFCRGLRWRVLVSPIGKISILRATQAIYAGQFANQVLPMRLGEIIRTRIMSNWLSADFARVLPSVIIERIMDGLWSVIGLVFVVVMVPLPKILEKAGAILGIVIISSTVVIIYILAERERITNLDSAQPEMTWRSRITGFLKETSDELNRIGFGRVSLTAFGLSFLFLLLQILTFWMLIRAYGLHLPLVAGAAVYLIIHIGTILPNVPANVGVFQFFCILALIMFHVEKTVAAGFSIIVFFLLSMPLWLLGFIALNSSGVSIKSSV